MDTRNHHPSGAISVKVFGNEMRLVSFDDISWLQTEADNINMVDFLIKLARGGKKSFTKSFMFLDAETTIPTILGLPLKLHAEGTTVASLEVAGKFDIRNMFWGPMAFEVRGYVKPRSGGVSFKMRTHARTQTQTQTQTRTQTQTNTHIYTHIYTHTHTHTYTHIHTYIHTYTRSHTHARTHTYTHTHTHF